MHLRELFLTLSLFITISHQSEDTGVTWALLVAGSNGYFNYRHQVCLFRFENLNIFLKSYKGRCMSRLSNR